VLYNFIERINFLQLFSSLTTYLNVKEKLFTCHSQHILSIHKNKYGRQSFWRGQKYGKAGKNLYFCPTRKGKYTNSQTITGYGSIWKSKQ
jgi:hypothetical protein